MVATSIRATSPGSWPDGERTTPRPPRWSTDNGHLVSIVRRDLGTGAAPWLRLSDAYGRTLGYYESIRSLAAAVDLGDVRPVATGR